MTTLIHSYCSRHVLCVDHTKFENIGALKDHLIETKVFSKDACFFICNGRIVDDSDPVQKDVVYHTYPRILGGKGGFGSMLRSIGAQIEKTTNHEALRDLSGRRMRDVNNEKALKEWLEKQADKEKEREQRRQERIARRRAMPNHKFDDPVYDQQRSQLAESQEQALTEGLKKSHAGPSTSSESRKRKLDNETAGSSKQKKSTEWLGIDIDNLSDLDSDENSSSSDGNIGNIESVTGDLQPRSSSENSCKSTDVEEQPGTSSEKSCSSAADTQRSCNDGNEENRLDLNQKSAELENEHEDLHKVPETVEENKVYDQQPESSTESVSQTSNEKQQKEESMDGRKESEEKKEEKLCGSTEDPKTGPINLDTISSIEELLAYGLDPIKQELMSRGLKCGGTLEQRAERLLSVKGLTKEQIDPSLFAKNGGKNLKKKS